MYNNQIGTLLSFPCQLRLGGWLSHLRLSCYKLCYSGTKKNKRVRDGRALW